MQKLSEFNYQQVDFDKMDGLIPAVIQDTLTGKVLMLGFMNEEALQKTVQSGKATFFSRSKNRLWLKGETSGNYLNVTHLALDCDNDTLLARALPEGPACHKGNESCFDKDLDQSSAGFLDDLEHLLKSRKADRPEGSYTSSLFNKGIDKIAQKVGEEAVETVIASKNDDEAELIYEASDLLFHLMVLLVEKGVPLRSLLDELWKRHAK
jgi:phosphoribosyl-ATP pyrophosphohydrolase/phosphoribosyl-AMP cyclohydrolase